MVAQHLAQGHLHLEVVKRVPRLFHVAGRASIARCILEVLDHDALVLQLCQVGYPVLPASDLFDELQRMPRDLMAPHRHFGLVDVKLFQGRCRIGNLYREVQPYDAEFEQEGDIRSNTGPNRSLRACVRFEAETALRSWPSHPLLLASDNGQGRRGWKLEHGGDTGPASDVIEGIAGARLCVCFSMHLFDHLDILLPDVAPDVDVKAGVRHHLWWGADGESNTVDLGGLCLVRFHVFGCQHSVTGLAKLIACLVRLHVLLP
mmetsp:Transcript_18491/g.45393  ORF Transcript_18491/g.45393 Transcript_18491/m.45393 type:complete len:261 (+) Transcript_18491:879-1661(+)